MKRLLLIVSLLMLPLAACGGSPADEVLVSDNPTATLAPLLSQTPRYTATRVPSRTPIPTFTYTPTQTEIPPTPTLSPTPTMTPTVTGIVQSLQRVNVREAPEISSSAFESLAPGTGVQIIGRNADGTWYNVRLESGEEGWVSARLLRVNPTATPFPTSTPEPDLTALFLGTPMPTEVINSGNATATPPSSIRTGTPATTAPRATSTPAGSPIADVPIVDIETINATATALAGGAATIAPDDNDDRVLTVVPPTPDPDNPDATSSAPQRRATNTPPPDAKDVFAYCDDPNQGIPKPTNVRDGDYIEIWWGWFASSEEQVQDHIDAVNHELRFDGEEVEVDFNEYVTEIRRSGGSYVAYWYVPYGPIESGEHEIAYTATWDEQIYDGTAFFGPGSENPFEQASCTFTVP